MDSDVIRVNGRCPDDFAQMAAELATGIQYKLFGMMFLMFMVLCSDVFINRVLATFNGAVSQKSPTTWGTCLQGIFLVLFCITIDAAISQKII